MQVGGKETIPKYDPARDVPEGYHYDETAGNQAVDFFELGLTHVEAEWAGQPFTLRPWQRAIIKALFGWKRADGTRRYREAYIQIPRRSGKSTMAAGIALKLLFDDNEYAAKVISAAFTRKQAKYVFAIAKSMGNRNEYMRAMSKVVQHEIRVPSTESVYSAISNEAKQEFGGNLSGVIIDEFFTQQNWQLYSALSTSFGSRRNPLMVLITTAGNSRNPDNPCWERYQYALKVRSGEIEDPHFLPVIYELDEGDDWQDETTWEKANPNLGISPSLVYMQDFAKSAQRSTVKETDFRQLHLNEWITSARRWIPSDRWQACYGELDIQEQDTCYIAYDLSARRDMTAVVLLCCKDGIYHLQPHFWIPQDRIQEKEERGEFDYTQWHRDGFLYACPGPTIVVQQIEDKIYELADRYDIANVAYDPWRDGSGLAQRLSQRLDTVEYRQYWGHMSMATGEFERLVWEGKMRHNNNPVLNWNVDNCQVRRNPHNDEQILPCKDKGKEQNKIDGVAASIMALGQSLQTESEPRSVYEDRGILRI